MHNFEDIRQGSNYGLHFTDAGLKKILSELRLSYDPNFFAKCHKLDVVSKYYGFVRVISNRSFAKIAIYAKKWPKNAVFW